jgi:hypothetical protein
VLYSVALVQIVFFIKKKIFRNQEHRFIQPSETIGTMFKAVFIPSDSSTTIEERTFDSSGGLENDRSDYLVSLIVLLF